MPRITDRLVREFSRPERGNTVTWDNAVTGFGFRITAAGARSFVLRYVLHGRERRITIGGYPALSPSAARNQATRLRGELIGGADPLDARVNARKAPTMHHLASDYLERHAEPHKRPASRKNDQAMIDRFILPRLGRLKVAGVRRRDVEALHQALKNTPYQANRALALLSKMLGLAVLWDWRPDNPCKGVQRFPEESRERWLDTEEIGRLAQALTAYGNQGNGRDTSRRRAADAIRLLLLTGARKSEVLKATWDQFDIERGVWTKPSSHTKQKRTERVPLSAPALALVAELKEAAPEIAGTYLFPGDADGKPLQDIKKAWSRICKAADLEGVRLHDLRHTFASHLVSSGKSLELVGRLLGHTQAATTKRYAHLADDPLRDAANSYGALVEGASGEQKTAEIVPLRKNDTA